jgi:hypothetical protein
MSWVWDVENILLGMNTLNLVLLQMDNWHISFIYVLFTYTYELMLHSGFFPSIGTSWNQHQNRFRWRQAYRCIITKLCICASVRKCCWEGDSKAQWASRGATDGPRNLTLRNLAAFVHTSTDRLLLEVNFKFFQLGWKFTQINLCWQPCLCHACPLSSLWVLHDSLHDNCTPSFLNYKLL